MAHRNKRGVGCVGCAGFASSSFHGNFLLFKKRTRDVLKVCAALLKVSVFFFFCFFFFTQARYCARLAIVSAMKGKGNFSNRQRSLLPHRLSGPYFIFSSRRLHLVTTFTLHLPSWEANLKYSHRLLTPTCEPNSTHHLLRQRSTLSFRKSQTKKGLPLVCHLWRLVRK